MHLRTLTSISLAAITAAAASLIACSSDDTAVTPVATDAGTDSSVTTPATDSGATTMPVDAGSTADAAAGDGAVALGPGAAFKCASSGKDAWDTYGGNGGAAFVAVNESIVTNATTPAALAALPQFTKVGSGNPVSTADGVPTFKGKLAAFLVYAYGGPSSIKYTDGITYTGPQDMVTAHKGLAITSDQYTYFITNVVVPALTGNGVPAGGAGPDGGTLPDDVSTCFAPVVQDTAFVASIVGQ